MKKGYSIFLIFILVTGLLASSFVEPAFAKKQSVFQGISDAIKYPFHSAAKAVGWDGVIDKSSRYSEQTKYKPFLASWACQILIWESGKMAGASYQDIFNLTSICKGKI